MKNLLKICVFFTILLANINLRAQIINCNPDPNGEPWIAGTLPEITPEIQSELDAITELIINNKSEIKTLPYMVDNSKKIWFRDIFDQKDGCCGQASGVAYTYTYESDSLYNDFWINIELPDSIPTINCMTENTESKQLILTAGANMFTSDDDCETFTYTNELADELLYGYLDIEYNNGCVYALPYRYYKLYHKAAGADWKSYALPGVGIDCKRIFCTANGDVFLGTWAGIFKSTDNGETWTWVYEATSSTNFYKSFIECDDNVILVGFRGYIDTGGILRSVDAGETWTLINDLDGDAFVKNSKGELFVGVGSSYTTDSNLSKSIDNGITWEEVDGYPNVVNMVIDDNDVIYSSGDYHSTGIYCTKDGGKTYQCIYESDETFNLFISENDYLYAYNDKIFMRSKEPLKSTVGVLDTKNMKAISIYPNPTDNHVKIEADNMKLVEIYNTIGQLINKMDVNTDIVNIDMSDYNHGIYVLKVHLSNGQKYTDKLVVR